MSLAPHIIAQITNCIRQGMPGRKTAAVCGCSYNAVKRVKKKQPKVKLAADGRRKLLAPVVCWGCRNSIEVVPCQICATRRWVESKKKLQAASV